MRKAGFSPPNSLCLWKAVSAMLFIKKILPQQKNLRTLIKEKAEERINPPAKNDSFITAISDFLSSQAGNVISKQKDARKVEDFISLLSQVLGKSDEGLPVKDSKRKYKLHQQNNHQSYKAARE